MQYRLKKLANISVAGWATSASRSITGRFPEIDGWTTPTGAAVLLETVALVPHQDPEPSDAGGALAHFHQCRSEPKRPVGHVARGWPSTV